MSTLRCFVGVTLLALLWTSDACQVEPVSGFCGEQEIDEAYVGCNETSFATLERLCEQVLAQEVSWEIATTFNELEDIEEGSELEITVGDHIYGGRLEHFPRLESLWLRNCSAIGDLESEWIEFNQSSEGSDDLHVAPLSYEQARSGFVTIRFVWLSCPWGASSVQPAVNVRLRRSEWSIWWQNNWYALIPLSLLFSLGFCVVVVAVQARRSVRAPNSTSITTRTTQTSSSRDDVWRTTNMAQSDSVASISARKSSRIALYRPMRIEDPITPFQYVTPSTVPTRSPDEERLESWGVQAQSDIDLYRSELVRLNTMALTGENSEREYVGLFPVVNTAPPCDDAINDSFAIEHYSFLDWTGFNGSRLIHQATGEVNQASLYEDISDIVKSMNEGLTGGIWSDALSRYPRDLEHNPPRTPSDIEAAFKLWVKAANEMSEVRLSSSSLCLAFFYDPSGRLHTKIYCAVYVVRSSGPSFLSNASLDENSVYPTLPPQPPSVPTVTPPPPLPSVSPPPRYTSAMAGTSSNPPSLVSVAPPPPPAYESVSKAVEEDNE